MIATPLFVVVGNVNQGKSSVVAALSENETIPIDSYPGTTGVAATYVFKTGDEELFRIVDTPGFQRPRQVLAWLQKHASNAAERPDAVRAFVEAHAGGTEFPDEVELLRPILDGAGILYVVDASSHLEPANEAEMEILRWTGQPAMALVNRVRDRDHVGEWRPTLTQFFHIVREFDAHRASFADRIALLRGFREIRPEWSPAIDRAVAAMDREWQEREGAAALVIAGLVVDGLAHVEKCAIADGADETAVKQELEQAFREAQRQLESRARQAVERIYRHDDLQRDDPTLELLREDLFAEATWRLFGLTRKQLAKYGVLWGLAIGATVDLASFLVSGGTVTFMCGVVGGVAGWFGGEKIASFSSQSSGIARALWPADTGRFIVMGPVSNPRYAWMLLDRALVHCLAVRERSHARRDHLDMQVQPGFVASLPSELRDRLDKHMRDVLKGARKGCFDDGARQNLATALAEALRD